MFVVESDRMLNLTPHDINVMVKGGEVIFKASGAVARVVTETVKCRSMAVWKGGEGPDDVVGSDALGVVPIPVVRVQHGGVEGLVFPIKAGKPVLVSMFVAQVMREQGMNTERVFYPDTGPESAIRDEDGRIIGVRRLVQA